ncbi:hypothetical protein CTEN210_18275 [Chaetoceros tenuissimus]|nr:hypothetical protein CTEN210_18275 [Chaetoceros tenuissimus]
MDEIDISVIHPGSEFRDPDLLEPILKDHPDWPVLKAIMKTGVDLGLDKELKRDEDTRKKDFEDALKKGNSGTMRDPLAANTVKENQEKEVTYRRVIPITLECASKLKNASICPLGCAIQWTIDEEGRKKIKMRTTHNLSFEWLSGLSVNSMVEKKQLEEILYGHCLIRVIHIMHKMRLKHPEIAILLSKFDIDSAFRRMHSQPDQAPLFLTVLHDEDGDGAYLDTRMPFGANQGPGKFGKISETVTDLANHLMVNECWTPARLKSSFSKDIPPKKILPKSVKFGKAIPLLVDIKDHDSYWDVFVDDLINVTLDQMNLEGKAREAAAIALELLFRPNSDNEEVKRNTILSLKKLLAEGGQEEIRVILGWLINSREWNIKIPHEKATRWMSDIDELIEKGLHRQKVTRKDIESVLGKANEASFIVRELRFFFSRLRYRLKIAIKYRRAFLQPGEIEDLRLIRNTIEILSEKGRSLNHVSMTIPSLFLKQDASTSVGIGGFMDLGYGWRIIFHPEILKFFHINTLEHMAGVANIWMAIKLLNINGDGNGMKFLDQSDNMTAIAWMLRSTYYEKENRPEAILREIMARHLATLLFQSDTGTRRVSQQNKLRTEDDGRSGGDYLLDRISRAENDASEGVTKGTTDKDCEYFRKWRAFTTRAGLPLFLDNISREEQIKICGAFAYEIRHNRFGKKSLSKLKGDTVETTLDSVCKTFVANGIPSPQVGVNGKKGILIDRQIKGYKDEDEPTKRQPALPVRFFLFLSGLLCFNERERVIRDLILIAFFFLMRSCEYSETPNKKNKRTKLLELRDITFIVGGREIPWNGNIDNASEVLVTFRNQKNGQKMETISQSKTDLDLCPCKVMIRLVKRLRKYKETKGSTQINTYYFKGKIGLVRNTDITNKLKSTVRTMGKDDLGIESHEVGTHSLRASFALMMALMNIPDSRIMILGRWKSEAFKKYIQRQIIKVRDTTAYKALRSITSNFRIKMR